jgi:hypothetical protein
MTTAAVDALLAESTAVAGWPAHGVLRWYPTSTTFELHGALPPVADDQHRELMLTAGASLLNLRVLIRVLGLHPAIRLLPDPDQPELIAIVRPQGLRVITSEDRLLAGGIVQRSTSGAPGQSPAGPGGHQALPDRVLGLLQRAAKVEHSWLAKISPAVLHSRLTQAKAGFGGPDVAVIGTVLDSPVARLQAGQAMQRALLTATVNGVSAGPGPAVLSGPGDRAVVRELIGGGLWPQVLLSLESGSVQH